MKVGKRLSWPQTVASAVAVIATLAAGAAYAASRLDGVSSTDTIVTSSGNTTLSGTGGVQTPIIRVRFPESDRATRFVITAQGDLMNFGPSDYTRCNLVVNGRQIAAVSTIVGDPTASGAWGPAGFLSPFALTGGTEVPASGGLGALQCWHDHSDGAAPYVDGGASVWIHHTPSLQTSSQ